MSRDDYFCVGAIQPKVCYCEAREQIYEKNLRRQLELIDFNVMYWTQIMGAACRLVVFPEFALHGLPQGPDGSWNGVAIDIPGEETELLAQKAKALNIYIASHAWQEYPDFPGKPFAVGFLISPDGEVILKHHKLVPTKTIEVADTGPADAFDWFVEKFGDGLDAFFPVVETEIGHVGFQICGEGQYAEISRGLMMNGAEIILRPNAWVEPFMAAPQDIMAVVSQFNAFANMCYLIEANWSRYYHPGLPEGIGPGRSQIIDYTGRTITRAHDTGESGVAAEINIQNLRRYREESGVFSRMTYMPSEIFRKVYETQMWPMNTLTNRDSGLNMAEWAEIRRQVVENRRDIYTPARND